MDPVSRRLLKEIREIEKEKKEHTEIVELRPLTDDDLLHWKAILAGLPDTPYEGGQFELMIDVPSTYPIHPPQIHFKTTICHPNIHIKTGEICLDILKTAWSPAWTLQSVIMAISLLLSNPEPSSPLNCDAANLLRCNDLLGYRSLIRMYTLLYAYK
ncbi:ubiquitin-conjugating enzyme/RWD-like protein [Pilobolus umbonatus]|nr:ubiquitin-conjugating enzyme/RWD-like protein [Pilobolus umbonatus]